MVPADSLAGEIWIRLHVMRVSWIIAGMPFPIQRQLHAQACIAASACSLASWRGILPPDQARLDACVQFEMRKGGVSGFESLCRSWADLSGLGKFVRDDPSPNKLATWINAHADQGFLIAHDVYQNNIRDSVHITVVFCHDEQLWQADPANQTVRCTTVGQLHRTYAGDVAYMRLTCRAIAKFRGTWKRNKDALCVVSQFGSTLAEKGLLL